MALGALLGCSLLPAADLPAETTHWQWAGWGGGGFFWSAAFDATKDGVIYMGGDEAGVYKSEDHGKHWRLITNGLVNYGVFSLASDPIHSQTVYAATEGGLCKSTDGGEHWQLLPHTPANKLRITGEKGRSIRSIAIDPTDGNTLYAGSPAGKVYKSLDGGQNWSAVWEKTGTVYSLAVSPGNPSQIAAATSDSGLMLSEDAGKTWRRAPGPRKAASVAFASNSPGVIYAAFFAGGIWKSTDGGKAWTEVSPNTPRNISYREVVVSPANANNVYVIGAADWDGVFFRSSDGGDTWTEASALTVDHAANPTLPQEYRQGVAGLSQTTNLAINPRQPGELFISANWRSCISQDAGATWTESDRGADISCVHDIRFLGNTTYAAAMDEGVLASDDNGANWRALWPLKFDSQISGHAWRIAADSISGVQRIVATCSPWDLKNHPNRVILSTDGGKTFKIVTQGLPEYVPTANTMWGQGYARALAADPNNPQVLYLGIDGEPSDGKSGGGIFKSEDAGASWKQLPNQPPSRRVFYGLAVDPTDSNRLYWATCGTGGGLYRSEDAGRSWKSVFGKDPWVFNMLVTADGTVYCPGKNLWCSVDHGQTWKQLTGFKSDASIVGLATDPANPKTLWISATTWDNAAEGGVYKTVDGGATWHAITGDLPYTKPLVLRFNPTTRELWAGGVGLFKVKQ